MQRGHSGNRALLFRALLYYDLTVALPATPNRSIAVLVSTTYYLTQLCINGECTGSICLEWNLTECFLTSSIIPNIDKRKLCELACQNGTDASTCRGTSEFAHMVGLPEGGMSLRPGSPCDNFQVNCLTEIRARALYTSQVAIQLDVFRKTYVTRECHGMIFYFIFFLSFFRDTVTFS